MTSAGDVLTSARVVLLDFDGPVCSVFANRPADLIAEELRDNLRAYGVELTPAIGATDDPMAVLRGAVEISSSAAARVESLLAFNERLAVRTAEPTPGGNEFIAASAAANRPVVIVSNNTADAILSYLDAHELRQYVSAVVARDPADPGLMKPNPHPILRALGIVNADAADAVLVGDTPGDVQAARAAGTLVIGYANKPHKHRTLADADAITTDMHELADALTARAG